MAEMKPATVIGSETDVDFMTDLQIIAKGEPGKGAALQRMINRAGTNHTQLAEKLRCSRSTVTLWCNEDRWPPATTLRNALHALNLDRRILLKHFGGAMIPSNNEFDPKALAATLYASLFSEHDPFERERLIYDTLYEKVLISQGFKALNDTRAAIFFTERMDRWGEEERLRSQNTARDVTPQAAQWVAGQGVYESPSVSDTTTSGNSNPDESSDSSQDV